MSEDAVRSTTIYQRTTKDVFLGILSGIASFFKLMARNKIGFVGFLIVVLYFVISFLGPTFIPGDTKTKIDRIFEPPPGSIHWVWITKDGMSFPRLSTAGGIF